MITPFALSLSLVAATVAQTTPTASAAPTYEADLGCLATFTVAQGVLRRGDPRQDQIAAVMPDLRARMEAYLAEGVRDEGQFALELQEATNARRATFEAELPACLEREAARP